MRILTGLFARDVPPPVTGGASVAVAASALAGPAPHGVFLRATAAGFPVARPRHDLRYRWSFSDPGAWARLSPDGPCGRDRDRAFGFDTAHAFAAPGSYAVTCEVTDGVTTVSDTVTITVTDDAGHYAPGDIHVVSQAGDFTGAPAGAVQHTSFAAARAAAFGASTPVCILMRAGETFAEAGTFEFTEFQFAGGVKIGRFGAGARPVFDMSAVSMVLRFKDGTSASVILDGLRFEGGYDAATGEGGSAGNLNVNNWDGPIHVYDCEFDGLSIPVYPIFSDAKLILSSSEITNWSNYGLLVDNPDRVGLVGNYIHQKADASGGPGGKSADANGKLWANHGPMRFTGCNDSATVIRQNHLFSNQGWQNADSPNHAQECFRWGTSDAQNATLVVERNTMENGYRICQIGPNLTQAVGGPAGILFEKNVLLAHGQTGAFIEHGYDNAVYRNNVAIRTDTAKFIGDSRFLGNLNEVDVADMPVISECNTLVSLNDLKGISEGSLAANLTLTSRNNLIYTPNLEEPAGLSYEPLDVAPSAFPSLYEGYRYETVLDADYDTAGLTWATFRPLDGSAALGQATGPVPVDDFLGALRGGASALGAFASSGGLGTVLQAVVDQVTIDAASMATIDLVANDLDPAGGGLALVALDTTDTVGTVTDHGDGTVTYDPAGRFDGLAAGTSALDAFGYTVEDGTGTQAGARVRVTVNGTAAASNLDFSAMSTPVVWDDISVAQNDLTGTAKGTMRFTITMGASEGVIHASAEDDNKLGIGVYADRVRAVIGNWKNNREAYASAEAISIAPGVHEVVVFYQGMDPDPAGDAEVLFIYVDGQLAATGIKQPGTSDPDWRPGYPVGPAWTSIYEGWSGANVTNNSDWANGFAAADQFAWNGPDPEFEVWREETPTRS